ncbi:hypothetical protein JSO63_02760 [Riemerella anatipestifer]|uniref:hypothetical protein n=1 Tax=Riemerella anatipestifer TaxID=34085 RepID=UPI0030BA5211
MTQNYLNIKTPTLRELKAREKRRKENKIKFFIENFGHISEEDLETIVRSKN